MKGGVRKNLRAIEIRKKENNMKAQQHGETRRDLMVSVDY